MLGRGFWTYLYVSAFLQSAGHDGSVGKRKQSRWSRRVELLVYSSVACSSVAPDGEERVTVSVLASSFSIV